MPERDGASHRDWSGEATRLDRALAELGLARSRSHAAELVGEGKVSVDGVRSAKAGQRIGAGSSLAVAETDRYVSRAARKLLRALDVFGVDPAGRVALDLGASTGGFTQVLLERGAPIVQAIDVGHDQMVEELRSDARVRLVEGCNARELTAERLREDTGVEERPGLVVADLSFISLAHIFPAIERTAAADAELVLLIKPQFEVGRQGVRDGIVPTAELRAEAIRKVGDAASRHGYALRALEISPVAGARGNLEFLSLFTRGDGWDQTEWEGRIRELSDEAPPGRVRPVGEEEGAI